MQTKRDVRNAWVTRSSAILVYDDPIVEIVDLSSRGGPRVVGTIATEDWVREYVPVAGCIRRHHQHAVVLSRDQRSVRFLRLRRNIVDREKLDAWRARVRREGHASGQSVRRGNRHR